MPPISVMLKPSSSLCNLKCDYCFYNALAGQRESFSHGQMTTQTAETIIRKALGYTRGADVHFAFQGGEPLISGLSFFQNFTSAVKEYNRYGSRIYYSIQTNGTLIDRSWCNFFRDNNFLVGLSLDGYESVHDRFRKNNKGEGTFKDVLNAARLMESCQVNFNILTVVTPFAAKNIDNIYSYFKQSGFRYLQFIPSLAPLGGTGNHEMILTNEQYAGFMLRLFKMYYEDYMNGNYISIRHFDNYVQMVNGRTAEQCGMNGHCSLQFVIEGDGTVYPCDFYCVDEYKSGNIIYNSFETLAAKGINDFIMETPVTDQSCQSCGYYNICRSGGCKRYKVDTSYCPAYQKIFARVVPYMRCMS